MLFLWAGLTTLYAQSVSISQNQFDLSKRLTNRLVTDMVRDHQGFLWIGFEDGLCRYDGNEIISFKSTYPEPRHISGIKIEKIVPRSDNRLVIKYEYHKNALEVFNPITWKSELIDFSGLLKQKGEIIDICQSANGEKIVVLVSKPGLSTVYHLTEDNLLDFVYAVEKSDLNSISIQQTLQSDWLIYDDGQFIEFDASGKQRRSFHSPAIQELNYRRDEFVHFIHDFEDGDCIISFEAIPGLFILRQGVDTLEDLHDLIELEYYTHVWKDKKGNRLLYAGSSFRSKQRLFFWYQEFRSLQDVSSWLVNQNQVTTLYGEDFLQGFAIGFTNGFDIRHLIPGRFKRLLSQDVGLNEWGTSIRGMVKDNYQNTYVAREIDHWFKISQDGIVDTLNIIENENAFEVNFKCSRNLLSTGSYIVGSAHFPDDSYAILLYDPATNQTEVFPIEDHVQHMKQIGDTLWIACGERNHTGVLYTFHLGTKELFPFLDENQQNPFNIDLLLTIEEVKDGILWIGSRKGVYEVDIRNHYVRHLNHESPKPFNFIDTWVFDIRKHSSGRVFIGYRSAGFEIIDFENGTKKHFTEDDGLSNDDVAMMVEDSTGIMWIGTFNGLSKFDPKTEKFINFYASDGIPHNEFNRYSSFINEDGEIMMGTINGFVSFNPYELRVEKENPRILLSSLSYYKKDGTYSEMHDRFDEPIFLKVPASNRSIDLKFTLNNYLADIDNTFQYQVRTKEDAKWNDLGDVGELSLNYLQAGSYPIIVKGADKYGNPSLNEIRINVDVGQFIYESAWLYAGIAFLVIGLTFLMFRARFIQKIRLYRMRQNISRDLHDEVGSLLTGLAMKTDLLSMKVDPVLKPETKKLGTMGREAVRLMRDIVWSIDSSKKTLGDLLDRVNEFASEVFPEKSIEYVTELVGCDHNMKLKPEIRKNVYLIIRESINNIIKHSNATHVSIKLTKEESGKCEVVISDNGTNPELNGNSSGIGLKNMQERANDISGSLKIHRENGYEVRLSFIQK
jgi:hypothetical protein